jgi:hypothetical protein
MDDLSGSMCIIALPAAHTLELRLRAAAQLGSPAVPEYLGDLPMTRPA